MMRKVLSLIISLICSISIAASNVITYTATEKLTEYTLKIGATTFGSAITSHTFNDGIGTITCEGEVTMIGNRAFCNCFNLTSVAISNSVTTIEDYAFFGCSNLTSVTIPNSVTTLGEWAFYACSSLTSIEIPNSVTTIGNQIFEDCRGLTAVTIGNSVTTIGYRAFFGCSKLTFPIYNANCFAFMPTSYIGDYTIPSGIKQIAGGAFYDCSGLTSVTIPNSVIKIGKNAFSGCSGLTSPIYNANCFAFMPTSYTGDYTIPSGIKQIAEGAFFVCPYLTSVSIPNSVTTIENYAFHVCPCLALISIPNSVTMIGECAFYMCSGLTSINVDVSNTHFSSIDGILYNYALDTLIQYPMGNTKTEYTIPHSVKVIKKHAFDYCTNLTSITISNSVTTIGDYAFCKCSGLISVTIPNSVTSIGSYAFADCLGLTSIKCFAINPPLCGYDVFGNTSSGISQAPKVYVLVSSLSAYQSADVWKDLQLFPLEANEMPIEGNDPIITPTDQDVTITWPITDGTDTYTLTITKNGEVVCVLTFNTNGQLTNIAFAAPGHNGAHQAPAATLTAQGYQFTVMGLNPGTSYNYSVIATNAGGKTLAEHKGNFSTTGGESDLQNVRNGVKASKYFHNGNLIIERNGVKYTPAGQKAW